jgi:xylose isomerase
MADSHVPELAVPTMAPGETYTELLGDPTSYEDFDADAVGAPGYGYARLDQLAVEHVLGARG